MISAMERGRRKRIQAIGAKQGAFVEASGFAGDTVVITPDYPRPIRSLARGDRVVVFDELTGDFVTTHLEQILLFRGGYEVIEVQLGRHTVPVQATADQAFFDGLIWHPCFDLRLALTATGDVHAVQAFATGTFVEEIYHPVTHFGTCLVGDEAAVAKAAPLPSAIRAAGRRRQAAGASLSLVQAA